MERLIEQREDLPPTLVKRMSNDREIVAFDNWRLTKPEQGAFKSALATDARYDKQRVRYVAKGGEEEMRHALSRYIQENKQQRFDFDLERCTWENLFEQLENARTAYKVKAEGNPFRRAFRHGEALSRNFGPLLEAIPNDDGMGVLRGALALLFNAVKRRSQACEKIFAAFEAIPELILQAQELRASFPQEDVLSLRIEDLCSALVYAIPSLIDILLRKGDDSYKIYKDIGRSIFGDAIADVEGVLQPVTVAKRKLEQCATSSVNKRQAEDSRVIRASNIELSAMRLNQHGIRSDVRLVGRQMQQAHGKMDDIRGKIEEMDHDNKLILRKLQEMEYGLGCLDPLYMLVIEMRRSRELQAFDRQVAGLLAAPAFGYITSITQDQILDVLCDDSEHLAASQDRNLVLRKYHDFTDKALGQSAYLMATREFREWLVGWGSDMLLVDGHCAEHNIGKISAMSVFCAILVDTLTTMPTGSSQTEDTRIVLYFFCGQHASYDGPLAGPVGLIRSLISQLFLAWPKRSRLDLSFIEDVAGLWHDVQDHRIDALCWIFQEILSQLPSDVVIHCMIDGISQYETSARGWRDQLRLVVTCFERCIADNNQNNSQNASFKVILASADKSIDIYSIVHQDRRVDLRAGNFLPRPSPQALIASIQNEMHNQESPFELARRPPLFRRGIEERSESEVLVPAARWHASDAPLDDRDMLSTPAITRNRASSR